ncbi:hypothetical protein [Limosilactobacillus fermentum]
MVAIITVLATVVATSLIPKDLVNEPASFKERLVLFSDRRIQTSDRLLPFARPG